MYQTEHQKVIQEYFKNHPNQGFTAKAICDIFADTMHQATIYRKLASLEEANIIRKIYLPKQDVYAYQYVECDCPTHLHLICTSCGKTLHLACEQSIDFLNHVMKNHHFNVDRFQSVIFGLCEECSQHD